MKKIFLFFFSIIVSNTFSQNKATGITLAKANSSINTVQQIDGKGVLFSACSSPSKLIPSFKLESNVILVDDELNVLWNKSFEVPIKNVNMPISLSSANSTGAYWFYFENGTDFIAKKITWDGKESDIVINNIDKKIAVSSPFPNVCFVDKDILYCIIKYIEKDIIKTYIYTINFETKVVTPLENNLPDRKEAKFCRGWRYMGNADGKIYFKSMNVANVSRDKDIATSIAVIDYSGKLISSVDFKVDFSSKVPFWVYNFQEQNGVYFSDNFSANQDVPYITDQIIYDISSMKLSPDKKSVYIYSLYKDMGGLGNDLSGFLVAKYSIDGKKIWQNNYSFEQNVEVDKGITHHPSQTDLNVCFNVSNDEKTVNFHFWKFNKKGTYHGIVSSTDGKMVDFFKTDNFTWPSSVNEGPAGTIPVTSKEYNQELVTLLTQKGDKPGIKKAGKNYFVYDVKPTDGNKIKMHSYGIK